MVEKMTRDFFIRLTLAAHKVANILPQKESVGAQMQDSANKLLADLVVLAKEGIATLEYKRQVTPRAIRELGVLVGYINYAKRTSKVNPENFVVLEREYKNVGEFLRKLHEDTAAGSVQFDARLEQSLSSFPPLSAQTPAGNAQQNAPADKTELSSRQTKILELMRNKDKVQVWELQKVLPEVTKRTLRRDLDDLLGRNLIVRQGEWNEVFYQIR
jgi:DNA-binding NarL/FixJ family response regulator